MKTNSKILQLEGAIQHYQWGGNAFIPNLLGVQNAENEPFAELWVGAHAKGPAKVIQGDQKIALNEFIKNDPQAILGEGVAKQFGNRLPFLLKILDVQSMLSIQVHPTIEQAKIGFQDENADGVPITAPYRNFRDDNHKPEIMVALTDFWLLHGFRQVEEIEEVLNTIPEFESLKSFFVEKDIFKLYKGIMTLSQPEVKTILEPLKERLYQKYTESSVDRGNPDYWAYKAFKRSETWETEDYDVGIFSIYLLNLVELKKGEGIFQDAGILHAYLEGVNVELMANSDNVLRGGLTYKHVDVPMLLKHLSFESVTPKVLEGDQISDVEKQYAAPVPDFGLSKIELEGQQSFESTGDSGPDALIVLEGTINVGDHHFQQGDVFFAPAGAKYHITASKTSTIFRATVPKRTP